MRETLVGIALASIAIGIISGYSCGPLSEPLTKIESILPTGERTVTHMRGGQVEAQTQYDHMKRCTAKMYFDSRNRMHDVTFDPHSGKEIKHTISK